jgi:hypothetical protein
VYELAFIVPVAAFGTIEFPNDAEVLWLNAVVGCDPNILFAVLMPSPPGCPNGGNGFDTGAEKRFTDGSDSVPNLVLLLVDPNKNGPDGAGGWLVVTLLPNNDGAATLPNAGAVDGAAVMDGTMGLPNSDGAEDVDDDVGGISVGAFEPLMG